MMQLHSYFLPFETEHRGGTSHTRLAAQSIHSMTHTLRDTRTHDSDVKRGLKPLQGRVGPGMATLQPPIALFTQKVREVHAAEPAVLAKIEKRLGSPVEVQNRLLPIARPLNRSKAFSLCILQRPDVVNQHRVQNALLLHRL